MSLSEIVPDGRGFTASNGFSARFIDPVTDVGPAMWIDGETLTPHQVNALREFFRHEEDERLGRFRFTDEDGDVSLVYPDPLDENSFVVVVERSGRSVRIGRNAPAHEDWRKPLDAYLAAHPEPKPAWHDAKSGEIWALNVSGTEMGAVRLYGPDWRLSNGNLLVARDGRISAGRRIWPEDAS